MARGWESKAVEAQQAEASEKGSVPHRHLSAADAARLRAVEGLRLSRQRILQQLAASQDPRHRKMLEGALADLEQKIRGLDGDASAHPRSAEGEQR